jgi:hypothetical protein
MTIEKTPLKIDQWKGGLLVPNCVDDPRPEPPDNITYEQWMETIEWSHTQTFGSVTGGFNFEVWALKGKSIWIMCIDAGGSHSRDVLVHGFADYLDIMAMMAPIATASVIEPDTLASIFEGYRESDAARKAMREMGKQVVESVKKSMDSVAACDCPACLERAKEEAEAKTAGMN